MGLILDQQYSHQPARILRRLSIRDKADAKLTFGREAVSFASATAVMCPQCQSSGRLQMKVQRCRAFGVCKVAGPTILVVPRRRRMITRRFLVSAGSIGVAVVFLKTGIRGERSASLMAAT
jgi:hypothetical protein